MSAQETPQGIAAYEDLLWVHSVVRRDLEIVERLAEAADGGLAAPVLAAEIDQLKTSGPLWRLKVSCLTYCRFVHSHHNAEDVLLFPTLRDADPQIGPVVDRLEADHRRVSAILDEIELAAAMLGDESDESGARERIVAGLEELHGELLEHLDYEEANAGPVLRRLERLPWR